MWNVYYVYFLTIVYNSLQNQKISLHNYNEFNNTDNKSALPLAQDCQMDVKVHTVQHNWEGNKTKSTSSKMFPNIELLKREQNLKHKQPKIAPTHI